MAWEISSIAYFFDRSTAKVFTWIAKILILEVYFCFISRNKHLAIERLSEPD